MVKRVGSRGKDIRQFILQNVEKKESGIGNITARHFSISRQAVYRHLKNLGSEGALTATGNTRNRTYKLCPLLECRKAYVVEPGLEEDLVWHRDVLPIVQNFPENVVDMWHFCFTEMFNNAVDHSEGQHIYLRITKTAANTQMLLVDDGVGIFKKIQAALKLTDERHATLELCKGKLTTDPQRHTGQGIFFTSRLLDSFDILSGGVYFSHMLGTEEDWIVEPPTVHSGTSIFMKLNNHTSKTCKKVFDKYGDEKDLVSFVKTVVPVRLAQYGNDKLISRSQAKRVLSRVELFKQGVFDFEGVLSIGQAFADEIFRVFANSHPQIELIAIRANSEVRRMIVSARAEKMGKISSATS